MLNPRQLWHKARAVMTVWVFSVPRVDMTGNSLVLCYFAYTTTITLCVNM